MIKNLYKCPKSLWNRMPEESREEYNRCMELTDFRQWMENLGEPINDHRILAHNFLICTLPIFSKNSLDK